MKSSPTPAPTSCARSAVAIALAVCALPVTAQRAEPGAQPAESTVSRSAAATPILHALVTEALLHNPEIRAAAKEQEAASQRVSVAGALDDPMLEAGLLNLPASNFSVSREDMTMKMLGLSQRFPYPGKRDLRRHVAQREADALGHGYRETRNRVARDVRLAYAELALVLQSGRIVDQTRVLLAHLLELAERRYAVGQATQMDVLRAQGALAKTREELLKLARERPMQEAELLRLLGRSERAPLPSPPELELKPVAMALADLQSQAASTRPQLLALRSLASRGEHARELARKDALPDFDVRLSYGQRNSMPDGSSRADMISVTVAMNLPVWRESKTGPKLAEAQALHEQALSMYEAQRNEAYARLRQQMALVEQSQRGADLYERELIPQARVSMEAAMAAYQVNRLDFAPLLDNRMAILEFELARATAIANHHKALAEIDFLVGVAPAHSTAQAVGP